MPSTLRDLLIQRAARLQGRPALTAPDWGTLSYAQLRNRVEGVALGILSVEPPLVVFSATGTAWDWAAEVAAHGTGIIQKKVGVLEIEQHSDVENDAHYQKNALLPPFGRSIHVAD